MSDTERYVKSGSIRGQKIKYPDGIGYSIWEIFKEDGDEDDEGTGLGFDYAEEKAEDVKKVVCQLLKEEPVIYEPDEEYENRIKKLEEKKQKLWYKIYESLCDIGIHFTPFYWKFTRIFITRPVTHGKGKNTLEMHKVCSGFYFGPLCMTWPR